MNIYDVRSIVAIDLLRHISSAMPVPQPLWKPSGNPGKVWVVTTGGYILMSVQELEEVYEELCKEIEKEENDVPT